MPLREDELAEEGFCLGFLEDAGASPERGRPLLPERAPIEEGKSLSLACSSFAALSWGLGFRV